VTASSQNLPGVPSPASPRPSARSLQMAVAVAHAAPVPLSSVQVTAGVIRAAMEGGSATAEEIAQAEQDAGVIFDPRRAQEIWDAGYQQAKDEASAELAQAAQDRDARDWFHARQRAVGQLCEGRPLDYCVEVSEVLAALDGRTPTSAPLTITWDGFVVGPSGDTPNENTLVPCTTARGGRAVLVLGDEKRLELGGFLLAVLHSAEGCTTPGCGMSADDLDASDPTVSGWVLVDVAGTEGGPRWWCNPLCAQAAMVAAGAELAAADQLAAVDPDEQVPYVLTPEVATGWEAGEEPEGVQADEHGDDGDGAL
jgi:hypothetical protein